MAESDPGKDASLHGGIMEETGNGGFQAPPPLLYFSVSFKDTALTGNGRLSWMEMEEAEKVRTSNSLKETDAWLWPSDRSRSSN